MLFLARPSISANITSKHLTNYQKSVRCKTESLIKGDSDKIIPPDFLSPSQKSIFNFIADNLKSSNILSNLDVYVLSECSVALDRMQYIESRINDDSDLLQDSSLIATKDRYTKSFFRCCNELCLSPQARAKIANSNLQSDESPLASLMAALNE